MAEGSGNKLIFLIGLIAVVAAIVVAVLLNRPLYEENRKLEQQRAKLAIEVEAQRREIQEMNDRCLRFESDPEFVERQARINHRIRPGEIEFIFDAPE